MSAKHVRLIDSNASDCCLQQESDVDMSIAPNTACWEILHGEQPIMSSIINQQSKVDLIVFVPIFLKVLVRLVQMEPIYESLADDSSSSLAYEWVLPEAMLQSDPVVFASLDRFRASPAAPLLQNGLRTDTHEHELVLKGEVKKIVLSISIVICVSKYPKSIGNYVYPGAFLTSFVGFCWLVVRQQKRHIR